MYVNFLHIAKKNIQFIFLWMGIFLVPDAIANHVIGGEVTYTKIAGLKYKFTATVYRNCNECQFNTSNCADIKTLDVLVSPEQSGTYRKVGSIALGLKSKSDITPLCRIYQSSCNGGSFSRGIEKWEYTGEVDFDTITKDFCQFEIGIRIESRLNAYSIGTSEAFYNFTRLYLCNGESNNSVAFQSPAYYLMAQNESFTYNLLATDADGDSLSYKLVTAQKGFASNITYNGAYGAEYPLDVYCPGANCSLNETAWPIEGIGINAETGWMGFTPIIKGQTGFLVVEVSEWRTIGGKKVKVGVTRRDLQFEVIDAGNYAAKLFTPQLHYYTCAGEDLGIDIGVMDPLFAGIRDSVEMFVVSDLPGVTIQKVGSGNINQFDAFLSAKTNNTQARQKPYYITVYAKDNHCPVRITSYKTIAVTIVQKPNDDGVIQYTKCNKVEVSAANSAKEMAHSWFMFYKGNLLDSRQTANAEFEVPEPGKYFFLHQIKNETTGCISERMDSLIVPFFSLIKQNFNWPEKVCYNEMNSLDAATTGGTVPFKYFWNGVPGTKTFGFKIKKDSVFSLRIIDESGCEMYTEASIGIFDRPVIQSTDTSLCLPVVASKIDVTNRYNVSPWYNWQADKMYYSGFGNLYKSNDRYYFEPTQRGVSVFEVFHKDSNSCTIKDTFAVKVIKAAKTNIKQQVSLCSNSTLTDLNLLTGNSMKNGVWYGVSNIVNNHWIDPAKSITPIFNVYYANDTAGCIVRDTTTLEILQAPQASILQPSKKIQCETDADFRLSALPVNGTWYDNALNQNGLVTPSLLIKSGYREVTYIYLSTNTNNGCSDRDTLKLKINPGAKLNVATDFTVCSGDALNLKPKFENITALKLDGDFSGIDVERVGDQFVLNAHAETKEIRNITLSGTALEGCYDTALAIEIEIKPVPSMTLQSTSDSGCAPLYFDLTAVSLNPNATPSEIYWYNASGWGLGTETKKCFLDFAGSAAFEMFAVLEGCSSEIITKNIVAHPTPAAQMKINPESQTVTADFTQLTFENTTRFSGNSTGKWTFEQGTPSVSMVKKVNVDFPSDTGLYDVTLEVRSDKGCVSTTRSVIRVKPSARFFAPNAFTPDSKGPDANEGFRVYMDSAVLFRMTIRNKWGEIVFKSETPDKTWSGDYLGKPAPAGAYIWEMEAVTEFGRQLKKSGTVVLIR